jgi:choline-sulfatase
MLPRRNLLIILTCGFRSDAISDERAWPLTTSKLEALASRGLRLVANSACPTDGGGLASLLTALHARQHGFVADTQPRDLHILQGLPLWLRDAGYHLAGVGAVSPIAPLLHQSVLTEDLALLNPTHCAYFKHVRDKGVAPAIIIQRRQRLRTGPFEPERLMLDPDEDIDGFISMQAIRALEQMPTDKPWALFVIFTGPGNDLPPPTLYDGIVEPKYLHDAFVPADFKTLDALAEPCYPRILLQRLEPHSLGRLRADYLARVSLIDHCVGRLTQTTRQRPDAHQTWTIFTSDRGHLLGEHGLVGRRSFLSAAVQVPLIIAPPENLMPKPQHSEGLYSTIDVPATIAALGGCDTPPSTTGRSLLPLFNGDPVLPALDGGLLSEFNDRVMLETERHKIVFQRTDRRCLGLYDLLNDPNEKTNLLGTDLGRNLVDSLRWRLADALLPLRAAPV